MLDFRRKLNEKLFVFSSRLDSIIGDPHHHNHQAPSSSRHPILYTPTASNQANSIHHHHQRQQSSPLTQTFWTLFWLAILLTFAFPVGMVCGQLYVLLSPLNAWLQGWCMDRTMSLLLSCMHLPRTCTQKLIQAKPLVPV